MPRKTPVALTDLEELEAKVKALQDALIAGEESGEPRLFDFEAFNARLHAPNVGLSKAVRASTHPTLTRYGQYSIKQVANWHNL